MSGINFDSTQFSQRLMDIEALVNDPKSKQMVNGKLEIVKRDNGFLRFLKYMVLPIARFFGADPFGSTRVNKVATELLSQYQALESDLGTEDQTRLAGILKKLNDQTRGRYNKVLNVYIKALDPSFVASASTSSATNTPVSSTGSTPPPEAPPPPKPFVIGSKPSGNFLDGIANHKGLKKVENGDKAEESKPLDPLMAQLAAKIAQQKQNRPAIVGSLEAKASQATSGSAGHSPTDPWEVFGAKKNH